MRPRGTLAGAVRRLLAPRRTIRPTREGWWVLAAVLALGFAAVNTGNNLLYLITSLVLGLIVVSGILSERTIRGLELSFAAPEEIFAERRTLFGATLTNTKRWTVSYAVTVEAARHEGGPALLHVPRLAAGAQRLLTWEDVMPRRGRRRPPGLRITTVFPFGLFRKAAPVVVVPEVIVFPAVRDVAPDGDGHADTGDTVSPRRGHGTEPHGVREYRAGDDPRLVHWPSTARTGALVVRELRADTARGARILLVPSGDPGRLEAGLSDAASLVVSLLRQGARVELEGPGTRVALGAGRAQERAVLTALALFEPGRHAAQAAPLRGARASLRELRVLV